MIGYFFVMGNPSKGTDEEISFPSAVTFSSQLPSLQGKSVISQAARCFVLAKKADIRRQPATLRHV